MVGREAGFVPDTSKYNADPEFLPFPPRWVVAVAVLRYCGSARTVGPLLDLLDSGSTGLDVKIAAALALRDVHRRGHAVDPSRVAAIAMRVGRDPGAAAALRPQQFLLEASGGSKPSLPAETHDGRWKLAAALVPLLNELGLPCPSHLDALRDDPRHHVRRSLADAIWQG